MPDRDREPSGGRVERPGEGIGSLPSAGDHSIPGEAASPSFGNPAVRCRLTRGFASPPHDGFALIGKGLRCG